MGGREQFDMTNARNNTRGAFTGTPSETWRNSRRKMNTPESDATLTAVVRRRIRPGLQTEFETAMQNFISFALSWPGHLSIHVLRPGQKNPQEYTVVNRFVDLQSREAFKASTKYQEWMSTLRRFSEDNPHIIELSGLAGWFTLPELPTAIAPPRWKMALVTFVGVYPLTSMLPPLGRRFLPSWPALLVNVVVTALIVAALTWLIMPFLTRQLKRWLFNASE